MSVIVMDAIHGYFITRQFNELPIFIRYFLVHRDFILYCFFILLHTGFACRTTDYQKKQKKYQ
jgi:hypothetical protein